MITYPYCVDCKKYFPDNFKYCPFCGSRSSNTWEGLIDYCPVEELECYENTEHWQCGHRGDDYTTVTYNLQPMYHSKKIVTKDRDIIKHILCKREVF